MSREINFRAWNKHTNSMIKSVAILGLWENFMSKEMREHVDRVKSWKQFLNENKTEQYDSFIINDNLKHRT